MLRNPAGPPGAHGPEEPDSVSSSEAGISLERQDEAPSHWGGRWRKRLQRVSEGSGRSVEAPGRLSRSHKLLHPHSCLSRAEREVSGHRVTSMPQATHLPAEPSTGWLRSEAHPCQSMWHPHHPSLPTARQFSSALSWISASLPATTPTPGLNFCGCEEGWAGYVSGCDSEWQPWSWRGR